MTLDSTLRSHDPAALDAEIARSREELQRVVLPELRKISEALADGRGIYLDEHVAHWISRLFRLDDFDLLATQRKSGAPVPPEILRLAAASRELERRIMPLCEQREELSEEQRGDLSRMIHGFLTVCGS